MKNILLILLPISLFLVSCGGGNQDSEKIKTNTIEETVVEPKLLKEKTIIEKLSKFVADLNQFEGYAFIGALDGRCYMSFFSNSNDQYISQLRYQIDNYYQAKQDKVDESHVVDSLVRMSAKKDGFGLNKTDDFSNFYLKGKTSGLKASLNNGVISDMNSTGDIWFLLDTVDSKLIYVLTYSSNCRFNGHIELSLEQQVKIKELFMNRNLSKKEEEKILKSHDIFEITSNDPNFISLGDNKYKVLISKSKLIENSVGQKSEITKLFTCSIKNISDKNIDHIYLSTAFQSFKKTSLSYSYEVTSSIGDYYGIGQGKGVTLSFYDQNMYNFSSSYSINDTKILNSLKDIELTFNLKFDNPLNYNKEMTFSDFSIKDLINNEGFIKKWELYNHEYEQIYNEQTIAYENKITGLSPSITLHYFHELDRQNDKQSFKKEYQIYFELVDETNNVEKEVKIENNIEIVEDEVEIENEVEIEETETDEDEIIEIEEDDEDIYENEIVFQSTHLVEDPDGWTNFRETPKGKIITKLNNKTKCKFLDNNNGWFYIELEDGKKGYVYNTGLKTID